MILPFGATLILDSSNGPLQVCALIITQSFVLLSVSPLYVNYLKFLNS